MDEDVLAFVVQFHSYRDYFECHEILEERWKQDPPETRQLHWVALIQIAVAQYHYRRQNLTGAQRMLDRALEKTRHQAQALEKLGFKTPGLIQCLEKQLSVMKAGLPYESIRLPMEGFLIQGAEEVCRQQGILLYRDSDLQDQRILNRHLAIHR